MNFLRCIFIAANDSLLRIFLKFQALSEKKPEPNGSNPFLQISTLETSETFPSSETDMQDQAVSISAPNTTELSLIAAQNEITHLTNNLKRAQEAANRARDDAKKLRKDLSILQARLDLANAANRGLKEKIKAVPVNNGNEIKAQTETLIPETLAPEGTAIAGIEVSASISSTPLFPPLTCIQKWCEAVLPERVYLHPRAVEGAKKSKYQDPDLIYQALLLLGHDYHEMRAHRRDERCYLKAFQEKAKKLGLTDSISAEKSTRAQFNNLYTVTVAGKTIELEKHIGAGQSRNAAECLRVYYGWDPDKKVVVVGSLPAHLRNKLT